MQQPVADELAGSETAALLGGELPGPAHQLSGDHDGIGVVISGAFGQDMPDGDEQLASNGDDSDALGLTACQTLKFSFPMGMGVDSRPGTLDEHAAQVTAALLSDVPIAVGLTGSVDPRAEARVAHQFLGGGEAEDGANRSQDHHCGEQCEAGELHEIGQLFTPRGGHAEPPQLGVQVGKLLAEMLQGGDVVARAEALGGRGVQVGSPLPVVLGEEVARWGSEVMTVEDAVQAILGGSPLFDQGVAMGEQGTEFADRWRGYPDLRDEVGGQQLGELDSVVLVGLDGGGNPLDLQGIGDDGSPSRSVPGQRSHHSSRIGYRFRAQIQLHSNNNRMNPTALAGAQIGGLTRFQSAF